MLLFGRIHVFFEGRNDRSVRLFQNACHQRLLCQEKTHCGIGKKKRHAFDSHRSRIPRSMAKIPLTRKTAFPILSLTKKGSSYQKNIG